MTGAEAVRHLSSFVERFIRIRTTDPATGISAYVGPIILFSAIRQADALHGPAYARELTLRLYEHRWIPSADLAGRVIAHSVSDSRQRAGDAELLRTTINDARRRIDGAKDTVRDLTEWVEATHLLDAEVWALMFYLKQSTESSAEKWYRFFAEADADIIATRSGLEHSQEDPLRFAKTYLVSERARTTNRKEFEQRLDYNYRARTILPRFWCELAKQHYETPEAQLPAALYDVDPYRVASLGMLSVFGMRTRG